MSSRRIILGMISLALLAAWYYLGYSPNRAQIAGVEGQLRAAETQLADYKTTIAQVPALIRASVEMSSRRDKQASVLIAKNDILRLFDQLKSLAGNEKMSVLEITPPVNELLTLNAQAEKPGEPLFLNVTIRLSGDYVGFGRFVTSVEQLPYFRGSNLCSALGVVDKGSPVVYTFGFKTLLANSGGRG